MKCLVVDDEPLAQQVMEDFINRVPFLEFAGKCASAFEAMDILQQKSIDLLFLDINMPGMRGIDMIASLPVRPLFILTTAYSEYAIESYALNATDYLLKPVPFDRFMTAINKANEIYTLRKQARDIHAAKSDEPSPDHFFVRANYRNIRINYDEIRFMEGLKDYVRIHLYGKKSILTLQTMKNMVSLLPPQRFLRVHKSFIVNLGQIDALERNRVLIGERSIPVGDGYREELHKRIKGKQA